MFQVRGRHHLYKGRKDACLCSFFFFFSLRTSRRTVRREVPQAPKYQSPSLSLGSRAFELALLSLCSFLPVGTWQMAKDRPCQHIWRSALKGKRGVGKGGGEKRRGRDSRWFCFPHFSCSLLCALLEEVEQVRGHWEKSGLRSVLLK